MRSTTIIHDLQGLLMVFLLLVFHPRPILLHPVQVGPTLAMTHQFQEILANLSTLNYGEPCSWEAELKRSRVGSDALNLVQQALNGSVPDMDVRAREILNRLHDLASTSTQYCDGDKLLSCNQETLKCDCEVSGGNTAEMMRNFHVTRDSGSSCVLAPGSRCLPTDGPAKSPFRCAQGSGCLTLEGSMTCTTRNVQTLFSSNSSYGPLVLNGQSRQAARSRIAQLIQDGLCSCVEMEEEEIEVEISPETTGSNSCSDRSMLSHLMYIPVFVIFKIRFPYVT